jgi:hypothetical protein
MPRPGSPAGLRRLQVVGVGGNSGSELLVRPLHLRVVLLDVLAAGLDELFVVGRLEVMTAGALDRSHLYLLGL